ncbi:MAG: hypothetical protein ACRDKE_13115, partial [Solirubrobacterales bacterium]
MNANANWQLWTFLLVSVGAGSLLLANAKGGADVGVDDEVDSEFAIGPVRWLFHPITPSVAHVGPRPPERTMAQAYYAVAYIVFIPIRAVFRLVMLLLFPPPRVGDFISIALPGATARFAIIVVASATETQLSTHIVHESESRKRSFRLSSEGMPEATHEIALN